MKLTLDALKERADAVASEELLLTISGGTENACHDNIGTPSGTPGEGSTQHFINAANALLDWILE
ncbi:MAG: hypothetical protein L3J23_08740 [Flavobacteriaceae bacterium]|nr:hypothetical protein [Flavobacteriaceae bacterium]